jgi:hypothetical protein
MQKFLLWLPNDGKFAKKVKGKCQTFALVPKMMENLQKK